MNPYEHITRMEDILNRHTELMDELNAVLDRVLRHRPEYAALVAYYGSDQWHRDLEADERGDIPRELRRGVLSEDAVYNLIDAYDSAGIRLLETALALLKNK